MGIPSKTLDFEEYERKKQIDWLMSQIEIAQKQIENGEYLTFEELKAKIEEARKQWNAH